MKFEFEICRIKWICPVLDAPLSLSEWAYPPWVRLQLGRIIETSMSAFGSVEWFILSLEKSFQVLSVLILLVYGNNPYYPIYMFLILNIYLEKELCMNAYLAI